MARKRKPNIRVNVNCGLCRETIDPVALRKEIDMPIDGKMVKRDVHIRCVEMRGVEALVKALYARMVAKKGIKPNPRWMPSTEA